MQKGFLSEYFDNVEKNAINDGIKNIVELLPSEYSEKIIKGFLNDEYYRLKYYNHLYNIKQGEQNV